MVCQQVSITYLLHHSEAPGTTSSLSSYCSAWLIVSGMLLSSASGGGACVDLVFLGVCQGLVLLSSKLKLKFEDSFNAGLKDYGVGFNSYIEVALLRPIVE